MTALKKFTLFPKLPPELRLLIWRYATPSCLNLQRYYSDPPTLLKLSLRRDKQYRFVNACRESRMVSSAFDATRDVLWLSQTQVDSLLRPDGEYLQTYDEALGPDVRPLIQRIHMPDVNIGGPLPHHYEQSFKDLSIRLPATFTGLREITFGKFYRTRTSNSTTTRRPRNHYAVMRNRTAMRLKARVEEAVAKEETLRVGWKAPVIMFEQLERCADDYLLA